MNIIKIDSWYDTDNTVISGFSYVYDALGRISEETHLDKNEKLCYTYDVLNRVTARTVKNATTDAVISTETFTYDAAGNITGGSANTTFVYDTNNRLVTYNGNAVSYDLDGNMLSNGSLACTYDSANRLLTAGGHTYTYNAEDVRIKKVHYGVEEKYTYDTNCKLSKMLTRTVGSSVTKYVYGHGLISEETNSTIKVYHFDYRGSTVVVTDSTGAITDTFEYDTYGKVIARTGTSDIIFCYNGRDGVVTDTNGLFYMRARYYSPDMRRFVNADVISGAISEAITLNRYAYANGNPVSNIDPFGLSPDNRSRTIVNKIDEIARDPLISEFLYFILIQDLKRRAFANKVASTTEAVRTWVKDVNKWLNDNALNADGTYSILDNDRIYGDVHPWHDQFFAITAPDSLLKFDMDNKDIKLGGTASLDLITGGWETEYFDLSLFDFGHAEIAAEIKPFSYELGAMASIWSPSVEFSFTLFGKKFSLELGGEIGAVGVLSKKNTDSISFGVAMGLGGMFELSWN